MPTLLPIIGRVLGAVLTSGYDAITERITVFNNEKCLLLDRYHYLNHLAIFGDKRKYHWFGGRYRSMAMGIMERLLQKYEN